jgi:hypothetical protein
MAAIQSNFSEISSLLDGLADTLRPSRKPAGSLRSIGAEILDITAVAIEARTVTGQMDPGGEPLKKLRPYTIARKIRLGYPLTIGIETHKMLDIAEIRGDQSVSDSEATMDYGLDDETRMKAEMFQEGGPYQKPREFFDLGSDGEKLIDEYIENEIIPAQIKALGG